MTRDDTKRAAHNRLQRDLRVINEYGEAHPESWSSTVFRNEPEVRLVAGFATEVAAHDAALREIVEFPDELAVERHPVSRLERYRIFDEIRALLREREAESGRSVASRYGPGSRQVNVRLRADQEPLGAELAARYADAVDLEVGNLSYPDMTSRWPTVAARHPPPLEVMPEGLALRLETTPPTVPYGFEGRAALHPANHGSATIQLPGQHHIGSVIDGDGRVIGTKLWSFTAKRL